MQSFNKPFSFSVSNTCFVVAKMTRLLIQFHCCQQLNVFLARLLFLIRTVDKSDIRETCCSLTVAQWNVTSVTFSSSLMR